MRPLRDPVWAMRTGLAALVILLAVALLVQVGQSGTLVFALVSTLDREALIECARAFLTESRQLSAGEGAPRAAASNPVGAV